MEFVSRDLFTLLSTFHPIVLVFVAFFVIIATAIVLMSFFDEMMVIVAGLFISGMVLLAGWIFLNPMDTQTRDVKEAISETYGLDLSEAQVRALSYPGTEPETASAVFGSTEVVEGMDGILEAEEVYLVWEDGLMKLATKEGNRYTPLEPVK